MPWSRRPSERLLLGVLLLSCLAWRLAILHFFWTDLNADPDTYLGLAQGIAAGHGYSVPGTTKPTAFRPPLYPLLLTPVSGPSQQWGRALLHLLIACGTLGLIWAVGRNLGLSLPQRILAAGLYCVDPLSLRYIAFPMTETTCACLVALLIWQLTRPAESSICSSFASGLVFGALVLSRPTFWLFGLAFATWWGWKSLNLFDLPRLVFGRRNREPRACERGNWRQALAGVCGVAVFVLPWTLRNWCVLGWPVVMTTHGGYTLLLGNNEAFYREVVQQPLGTIWDGSHGGGQSAWVSNVNRELESRGITSEVQADRWMAAQAWQTIQRHPETFLRACLIKFLWFWNIVPHTPAAQSLPAPVLWLVGTFYVFVWGGLLLGLGRILCRARSNSPTTGAWSIPFLLILTLSAAHLVYWSDARMRAPIVPAIVLISVLGMPQMGATGPADR